MSNIKKNDKVRIITGKDKGKEGDVLLINSSNNMIKVRGVKLVTRHQKARSQQEKSKIIIKEAFIHISNVELIKST
jgi:large subunit ribosomal protein L24